MVDYITLITQSLAIHLTKRTAAKKADGTEIHSCRICGMFIVVNVKVWMRFQKFCSADRISILTLASRSSQHLDILHARSHQILELPPLHNLSRRSLPDVSRYNQFVGAPNMLREMQQAFEDMLKLVTEVTIRYKNWPDDVYKKYFNDDETDNRRVAEMLFGICGYWVGHDIIWNPVEYSDERGNRLYASDQLEIWLGETGKLNEQCWGMTPRLVATLEVPSTMNDAINDLSSRGSTMRLSSLFFAYDEFSAVTCAQVPRKGPMSSMLLSRAAIIFHELLHWPAVSSSYRLNTGPGLYDWTAWDSPVTVAGAANPIANGFMPYNAYYLAKIKTGQDFMASVGNIENYVWLLLELYYAQKYLLPKVQVDGKDHGYFDVPDAREQDRWGRAKWNYGDFPNHFKFLIPD